LGKLGREGVVDGRFLGTASLGMTTSSRFVFGAESKGTAFLVIAGGLRLRRHFASRIGGCAQDDRKLEREVLGQQYRTLIDAIVGLKWLTLGVLNA
jgi:hypothetical protein